MALNHLMFWSFLFRNLIFRIIALLREGILPVAVTDGEAPALKAKVMQERRLASQ